MRVPFFIKFKAMLFKSTIYNSYRIKHLFLVRLLLHTFNFIYVFGGWILLSHYLDNIFDGLVSTIVSLFIVIFINLIVIYFSPLIVQNLKEE